MCFEYCFTQLNQWEKFCEPVWYHDIPTILYISDQTRNNHFSSHPNRVATLRNGIRSLGPSIRPYFTICLANCYAAKMLEAKKNGEDRRMSDVRKVRVRGYPIYHIHFADDLQAFQLGASFYSRLGKHIKERGIICNCMNLCWKHCASLSINKRILSAVCIFHEVTLVVWWFLDLQC